ncbi:MAG TPA: hypothetical protein PKM50_05540 [Methanoregula sp.]|nr:hypothetical protein [Methanoregula sp.]
MRKHVSVFLCAALLVLFACAVPAGAVVLEVTVKGTVAEVSPVNNSLTLANPEQYGCDYGSGATAPVCSWTPLNTSTLTGTVPDEAALSVFAKGDQAVAVSLGGTGGNWIALAKLYGSGANADYATDEIGDIGSLPVTLIGNYAINAETVPDCATCKGTSCMAATTNVTVTSGKMTAAQKILKPGESLFFNGRNDASSVNVTFVKGEALASLCPNSTPLVGGVQPVSDYIVHVVPPLGVNVTTTESPSTPAPATTSAPVTTTQKSGLPFAALGILCVGIAVLAVHYRRD